jgi:signal peptidase I
MLKEHSKFWIFYTGIALATMLGLIVPIIDPRYVMVGAIALLLVGRELLFHHMYQIFGGRQKYEEMLAAEERQQGKLVAYTTSIGSVVVIVVLLRAFIAEPYQVPTGSMLPTIQLGDYIIVSKSTYSLRIPMTSYSVWTYNTPKRGDIVIFEHPNPTKNEEKGMTLIKRVVAVEGDSLSIQSKVLQINGQPVPRTEEARPADEAFGAFNEAGTLSRYEEDLFGVKHPVLYDPFGGNNSISESISEWSRVGTKAHGCLWPEAFCVSDADKAKPFVIPPGYVFVMGDSRDNSADGRVWGPLPINHIRGKALFVGYAKSVDGWFRLLK